MTVVNKYLPSTNFIEGLPDGWAIIPGPHAPQPFIVGGTVNYDWSGVPSTSSAAAGAVRLDVNYSPDELVLYDIRVPNGTGEVTFTITLNRGPAEALNFSWRVGNIFCSISDRAPALGVTRQTIQGVNYGWTGSCTYRLWYPNGIDQPVRIDFDNGSLTATEIAGVPATHAANGTIDFATGNASTTDPDGSFPFVNAPKTGTAVVSGINIIAWDPMAPSSDGIEYAVIGGQWVLTPRFSATNGGWTETPLSLSFT